MFAKVKHLKRPYLWMFAKVKRWWRLWQLKEQMHQLKFLMSDSNEGVEKYAAEYLAAFDEYQSIKGLNKDPQEVFFLRAIVRVQIRRKTREAKP